jgi:hypothetical protein
MGRVYRELKVSGHKLWTLFDTGSRNTYVIEQAAAGLHIERSASPRKVALGGRTHRLTRVCLLKGRVEGKSVEMDAYLLKELGVDDNGRPIEVLFGALAMQKWGIRVCPDTESLDLTHYSREFVEY